jgi:lipopolysaccharide biosynthesis glycosyltransferase
MTSETADRTDLVLAVDEKYAPAVGAVACAARWYIPPHKRLSLHILDGGISPETKRALKSGVGATAEVTFYEIANRATSGIPYVGKLSHLNDTILLRLQVGEVLPRSIQRVIYLDADVLVHGDLSILSSWPLNGHAIGAVRDRFMPRGSPQLSNVLERERGYSIDRYFNSGVLVIDLDAWRAQRIGDRVHEALSRLGSQFGFPDQDALNFVLVENWLELPSQWDYLVGRKCPIPGGAAASRILATDGIVHFIGVTKPWHESFPDGPFLRLFSKAAAESGWRIRQPAG